MPTAAPPGAQHQHALHARAPIRRGVRQGVKKTKAIRVEGRDAAILLPAQHIGDAGFAAVGGSGGGLLVRHGDVDASEAETAQRADFALGSSLFSGMRDIDRVKAVIGDPAIVHDRRERVAHRIADHGEHARRTT